MVQLGTQSDGSPYTRRLTTRTRRLNLTNKDLVSLDLTALAKAPNLETLELGRNPLRTLDLTPLAHCSHLEGLVITAELPVDLAPLAACANLRWLHVHCQQWPTLDLSPLDGLTHFESIHINGDTFITLDLSPLANCPMRSLSLHCPSVRRVTLSPLAACAQLETISIQHTPVQELGLFPWPNLQRLNLLGVPLKAIDLTPLYDSQLGRLWFVEHTLAQVDLTPLVELETLKDVYFKPTPQLALDEVYVHYPKRILSLGVRKYVDLGLCVATGRFTRLKILLRLLKQRTPVVEQVYHTMDEPTFWRLIEDARRGAADGEHDMASELMCRLWTLNEEDLQRFFELFLHVMGLPGDDVHRAVYQVRGGCSDDTFRDFREWLIAQGRDTFYRVVNAPQVLYEWGESGLGFEQGIISMPLYQVCYARGICV